MIFHHGFYFSHPYWACAPRMLWLFLALLLLIAFAGERRALLALAGAFIVLGMAGCAAVEPQSILIEADHTSHISQHFGSNQSNDGYSDLGAYAHWSFGHAYLDIGDAYTPDTLDGRHEVFKARAGYEFVLKGGR